MDMARHQKNTDLDSLRQEYLIEKEIADRLRNSDKEQRRLLYKKLYDEFFQKVPNFAVSTRKAGSLSRGIIRQLRVLKPFLSKEEDFLEIGPGSCALSFEVTKFARHVCAVDVSEEIALRHDNPDNFSLIISDGVEIPLLANSIHTAYSNQLMEHLHPEDAFDQLKNICRAVMPGGRYVCITPNSIYGPSDVSRYFDNEPTGLHLKEYTYHELSELMIKAGFAKVQAVIGSKNMRLLFLVPASMMKIIEGFFLMIPRRLRKKIVSNKKIKRLLSVKLVATK